MYRNLFVFALVGCFCPAASGYADEYDARIAAALERAGENKAELKRALAEAPKEQRTGIRFLISHMPERDLKSLTAKYLLENTALAYGAWDRSGWKKQIPEDVFLNNVLPYASINERRDNWRAGFAKRFKPLVKEAKSPGQAAVILNQKIFGLLKVKYSTKRRKADQSPLESMESGLASCSGLSVLLIDACRSVGVPARFVGIPLWSDRSGNHSWVEVWDDGWHFTGAAEPSGDNLDRAWFTGRASTAKRDHPFHAIYAVSFKSTPIHFPLVWDQRIKYVSAVNVTDRYTKKPVKLPEGHVQMMFRAKQANGDRVQASIKIRDKSDRVVFEGKTRDERFDANDHLTVVLPNSGKYRVDAKWNSKAVSRTTAVEPGKLLTLQFE